MADEKISDMPAAAALTGAELVPIVQGGNNVRATAQNVANLKAATPPGGAANQIQYNAAGAFGGFTLGGDATLVVATGVLTIANNAITTAKINNSAVTLAKIANAAANSKLLGSGDAGVGAPYVELTLGTNLSITGTTLNAAITGINQLTGDVTAGPGTGSQAATLANFGPGAGTTVLANVTIDAKGRVSAIASAQSTGSFAPTVSFGGASSGITYSVNDASFIQIGSLFHFDMTITLTSKGTSVGVAIISGLPNANAGTRASICAMKLTNVSASDAAGGVAQVNPGSTQLQLMVNSASGNTAMTDTDFTNTTILNITGNYRV